MNDQLLAKTLYWLNIIFVILLALNIYFMIINQKLLNECKRLVNYCKQREDVTE